MLEIRGIGISGKKASGTAHHFVKMTNQYHSALHIEKDKEEAKLYKILDIAKNEIFCFVETEKVDKNAKEIFESHELFLTDNELIKYILNLLNQGYDLLSALIRTRDDMKTHFLNMESEIFRSKVSDIEDIFDRLIKIETGLHKEISYPDTPFILVCDDILPSMIFELPEENLKGILVRFGSNCSHGAIIARSKHIPVIIRLKNRIDQIKPNQKIVMNGESGAVFILDN